MFEASVDGQPYDPDRWAQYFKPAGFKGGSSDAAVDEDAAAPRAAAPVARPAPTVASAPADDTPPFDVDKAPPVASAPVEAPKASSQRAEDILAMIRNRQK